MNIMNSLIKYLYWKYWIPNTSPTWVVVIRRVRLSFHPWSKFFHAYFNTKDCSGQYWCLTICWNTIRIARRSVKWTKCMTAPLGSSTTKARLIKNEALRRNGRWMWTAAAYSRWILRSDASPSQTTWTLPYIWTENLSGLILKHPRLVKISGSMVRQPPKTHINHYHSTRVISIGWQNPMDKS